jgi:hypothetical protein
VILLVAVPMILAVSIGISYIAIPKPRLSVIVSPPTVSAPVAAPWEPGSTAFWLDPDLWLRTPEIDDRPAVCWMHLDDPVAGRDGETHFGGGHLAWQTVWYSGSATQHITTVVTHFDAD